MAGQFIEGQNCVYYDDFEAARNLARYVTAQCDGPIAYIGATRRDVSVGKLREDGFRAGLDDAGRPLDTRLYRVSPFTVEGGYACAQDLLGGDLVPKFISCATDTMAAGAIRALKEHGVEEPARFVSGFGDNQFLRAVTGAFWSQNNGEDRCGYDARPYGGRFKQGRWSAPYTTGACY